MPTTLLAAPEKTAVFNQTLMSRRNFLRLGAGCAAGLAFYAGEISRHELDLTYQTIKFRRLPDAFAGMKIVQISDLHFAEYTEASFLEAVVRKVNALAPDVVLLTGDFVSSDPLPLRMSIPMGYHCAEILNRIECRLRYAVMGNHDALVDARAITDALKTYGIAVLANRSLPLEREGKRLWLAGIEDALEQRPDLSQALPVGRPNSEPVILLAHEPDFADHAVGRQIDLVLSGHTHGGQILLPFLPPLMLPELGVKYVHGLFRFADGMQLYVNRGIGAVNLPFRFRCPPEITAFTLQPGV